MDGDEIDGAEQKRAKESNDGGKRKNIDESMNNDGTNDGLSAGGARCILTKTIDPK